MVDPHACPACGATTWVVPSTVEVELTFDGTAITAVKLTEATPVQGEGDIRCAACGEVLLDWGSMPTGMDAAFAAYHDARRPTWDDLHYDVAEALLPPPATWLPPDPEPEPEPEEEPDDPRPS